MSFGKLLAAGKSFAGGRGAAAYRKNKSVYLPKFGSPKNPFATSDKEPSQNAAVPDVKPSASVAAAPKKFPKLSARPVRATSWTEKLNPFRGSSPVTAVEESAVQVELSLDSVKVVHNDLSDADVEVVPIKSRPAASEVPVPPPAEKPWHHLGGRILKAS
jgi:hypothetical protein